jgi:hypothetical protein
MTTTLVLNLIAALFIVAALVGVSRLAHLVAGGLFDHRPAAETERRAVDQPAAHIDGLAA